MRQATYGDLRVQVLSDDIIRIELKGKNGFVDADTFFVPNKTQYESSAPNVKAGGRTVTVGEYTVTVPTDGSAKGITVEKTGTVVYKYRKAINNGELPALEKTPEVYAVYDNPRIIVPQCGYSVSRSGEYTVEENVVDVYLLLCGKDHKKLRRLYVELTGRCEMVRLSTLGAWNSKYFEYDEQSAMGQILDFEKYDMPLDNLVIDTDWRSCEHGWGYDVNTTLFPDMKKVLDFSHAHGVEVMFNDHPEPVEKAHVFEPREIEYRERNLQSLMAIGLDTWWYDRNWMTHLISPTENVYWETFGLYLFAEITKNYYQKTWKDKEVYRRPVVMGNVVNVANGTYKGITDSASHRYSIQWTGDIMSDKGALAQEVDTLIRAGNSCIAYVNADCGGHIGNPDGELFVRWMQFGALSPVFRPHCTKDVARSREPWVYGDDEVLSVTREYYKLRYRLLPVIYENAHFNYETGAPIFRSVQWNYPEDKRARRNDEYMLGDNILISPIAGKPPEGALAAKYYTSNVKATFYDGRELEGEPIAHAEWKTLEMKLEHTPPTANVPAYDFSARFETKVKFDKKMKLGISCDDGATVYIDGKKVLEDKTLHAAVYSELGVYDANEEHDIVIEYFQAGGEACCILCADVYVEDEPKQVYLPQGEWINLFDGEVIKGNSMYKREYELREMPLFVRRGALVPLAYDAQNTRAQKWNRLVYDYYPSKTASDAGALYEDDTESTAYKRGEYRTSAHKAYFDKSANAFAVELAAAQGKFKGEKAFDEREIAVKFHLTDGIAVERVTVNGKDVGFEISKKDKNAFPFGIGASPDADCVTVRFDRNVENSDKVLFYVR